MKILWFLLVFFCAPRLAAAPAAVGSPEAAAKPAKDSAPPEPEQAPVPAGTSDSMFVEYRMRSAGDQLRVGYSLRWENGKFSKVLPGFFGSFFQPLTTLRSIGSRASKGSLLRFNLYGLRLRPAGAFVVQKPGGVPEPGPEGGAPRAAVKPRRRLDLRPVWDELWTGIREDFFDEGLELFVPQTRRLGRADKRALLNGVTVLQRDREVPLLGLPVEGFGKLLEFSDHADDDAR